MINRLHAKIQIEPPIKVKIEHEFHCYYKPASVWASGIWSMRFGNFYVYKQKNEIKVQQSLLPVSLFEPFTFYLWHFVPAGLRHTNREN